MIKVNTEDLVAGMILARSIIEPDKSRVLLTAGQKLTPHYINRIKEIGISTVYIKDNLNLEETEPIVRDITIQNATKALKESYQNCLKTGRLRLDKLKGQVESIIQEIITNQDIAYSISDIKNYDDYTCQHSVSVCVLATLIGVSKGYNEKQLYELALGAILHDIGKITVPQEILNKPDKLNANEMQYILAHPWEGFNIIRNTKQVPLLSAHVALQHHERLDGLGYPRNLSGENIHEYARITAIADIFDALTSDRPYRVGFNNEQALKILQSEQNTKLEAELIEIVSHHIRLIPNGSVVLLSTGDTAVVIKENVKNPYAPVVKLLYNSSHQKYKNDKNVDLLEKTTIKIKRTLSSGEASRILSEYLIETMTNEN
ncbi:MAG: HD-GYP domain-containing protein [Syntrophomonadaceae bacterium]|nr:HD-GYP domain-containing protein [Syntrophomonadaceae bacterium]